MMASVLAGDDNTHRKDTEVVCVSLALAIKKEEADQFVKIYDSIPPAFDAKKVEAIKVRARELSEKSVDYLESYQSDLQRNGLESFLNPGEGRATSRPDINNNPLPGCSRPEAMAYLRSEANKRENGIVNGKDYGETRSGALLKSSPCMNGPVNGPHTNNINFINNTGDLRGQNSTKAVDEGIQFRLSNSILTKRTDNSEALRNSGTLKPEKFKTEILKTDASKTKILKTDFSKTDIAKTDKGPSEDDKGPYPPDKLLENSVSLIVKPKDCEVKNCPKPEPISSANDESGINETTPILGRAEGSRKRHGEQQRDIEIEVVYADDGLLNYHQNSSHHPNYGTCDNQGAPENPATEDTAGESTQGTEGSTRKKKKKKKKKGKQGDASAGTANEGETKQSTDGPSEPSSPFEDEVKKETAGPQSELINPATVQKPTKANDKSSKAVVSSGKKKTQSKKTKKQAEDASKKAHTSRKETQQEVPTEPEDVSESEGKSESDDITFAQWQMRTVGSAKTFDDKASEPESDNRTAMSDPGENEEDHGDFHVVTHRKGRHREKVTMYSGPRGFYPSRNYSMDDSSNSGSFRGRNPSWDLRKSSSLPKEMCKYSNGRRRIATSDPEELMSTTTTTTATSSRRDSLESDENLSDQKKHIIQSSPSSYASRLKASMHGSGHVQSTREAGRVETTSEEALSSTPQGNSKPNNSIQESRRLNVVVSKDTEDFQLNSKGKEANVKSTHSLSDAMNLEISPNQKFEMNFPGLTSSVAGTGGKERNPTQPQSNSVQYLNLEYNSTSYAGRVKQKATKSNNPATLLVPKSNEDANRTKLSILDCEKSVRQGIPKDQSLPTDNINMTCSTNCPTSSSNSPQQSQNLDMKPSQLGNLEKLKAKSCVSGKNEALQKDSSVTLAPAVKNSNEKVADNNQDPKKVRNKSLPYPPLPSEITFGSLIIGQDDEIRIVNDTTQMSGSNLELVTRQKSVDSKSGKSKPLVTRKENVEADKSSGSAPLVSKKPDKVRPLKGVYVSELESSMYLESPGEPKDVGKASSGIQFGSSVGALLEQAAGTDVPGQSSGVATESSKGTEKDWIRVLAGTADQAVKIHPDTTKEDDKVVILQLMSSADEVSIDVSGGWENTRRFNHAVVSEMLSKDWEQTVQQSKSDPSSVIFA